MKTEAGSIAKTTRPGSMAVLLATSTVVLLLAVPEVAQAQFLYTTNNGTITITDYTGSGDALTIPSTIHGLPVTEIGVGVFAGVLHLNQVVISDSVTNIGEEAFSGCMTLTSVTIGRGVTRIGDRAFYRCNSLASVTIPDSVTGIGDQAFASCIRLSSVVIPYSVTSIGSSVFDSCISLTGVTIGRGVTTIGDRAFRGCGSLTAIAVDTLNPSYSSLDGVLFNHDHSTLIRYPGAKAGSYTVPESVNNIANEAFSFCFRLTGVTIGRGVTSIGDRMFYQSDSLTGITVDELNTTYSSLDGVLSTGAKGR